MDKQELDQLIDKFLLGSLTQTEKSKLEAHIMEQPTAKLEIKMRADLMKGLEFNADQELKSILNKIHNEEISGSSKFFSLNKIRFIAASLVVILGVFGLYQYFNAPSEPTPEQLSVLYASYFEPYSPSLETRSNGLIQEEKYQTFINAYRDKDYQKSLETIKPIPENADNNTLLLAGISAMETDKNQESIEYLNKIILSNDFYFIDHAKWYKSLVLIKMKNLNEAKVLLNELANNPKADHHNESVALLKEI